MTRIRRNRNYGQTGQAQQGGQTRPQAQQGQSLAGLSQEEASRNAFGQIADTVREHPKTAIAAGAALAAGAAAAAVYGARGRGRSD